VSLLGKRSTRFRSVAESGQEFALGRSFVGEHVESVNNAVLDGERKEESRSFLKKRTKKLFAHKNYGGF
jgi:hypothetical protein